MPNPKFLVIKSYKYHRILPLFQAMDSMETDEGRHGDLEMQLPSKRRALLACINVHELFLPEMWRAALTELVGTAMLMFSLTTSITACLDSNEPSPKLLIPFAIFSIAFLFLMVTVPLSGGHMSPVFSWIASFRGIISFTRATIYILAQCIGSILGFSAIKSVMSHETVMKYSLGGCAISSNGLAPELAPLTAFMVEFVCTFIVLFVAVTVAFDKQRCKELGISMVCTIVAGTMSMVVFISVTVTGHPGYAGVGLNPARCLAPALLHGGSLWHGHWVFWMGPLSACLVYYAYAKNMPRDPFVMGDGKIDLASLIKLIGEKSGKSTSFQSVSLVS